MLKRLIDARGFRRWLAFILVFESGIYIGAHIPIGWVGWVGCMAALFAAGFIAP